METDKEFKVNAPTKDCRIVYVEPDPFLAERMRLEMEIVRKENRLRNAWTILLLIIVGIIVYLVG